MASRRMYDADSETVEACAASGDATVTARKLERWRQAGCLPARSTEHRSGLRGSASTNPHGYVEQVLAVSAALRDGVALRHVPIALFADGFPVDLGPLRAAYLDLLEALRKGFAAVGAGRGDPLDAADAVAVAFAARLGASMLAPMVARARQEAKQSAVRSRDEARGRLEGALSAAFGGLLAGQVPTLEGTRDLLTLAGLADGQDLETSARHLADTNLDAIEIAVRGADADRWLGARLMTEAICRFMDRRRSTERLLFPPDQRLPGLDLELPTGAFARGCLIPQQLVIGDYERDFAQRRTAAMDTLADFMEAGLTTRDPGTPAEPSEQERSEARARFTQWTADNPAQTKLLLVVDPLADLS